MKFFLVLFIFFGCAGTNQIIDSKEDASIFGKQNYNYQDQSGSYKYTREVTNKGSKLIVRQILYGNGGLELEQFISVSRMGMLKQKKGKSQISLLPEVSQFKVWFDKKEYFSQLKVNKKTRKLEVITKNPEENSSKESDYALARGKYFCFFSQIPECLIKQKLLLQAARKNVQLFVIWDNFPYHIDQYDGIRNEPFTSATLSLGKFDKKELKYILDIGSQVIFYHFNSNLEFEKMFWVSQGISLVKQKR